MLCFGRRRVFVWRAVVDLLIRNCFALRGVADAHAGYAAQGCIGCILASLALCQATVHAAHEPPTEHTDLADKNKACVGERRLQALLRCILQFHEAFLVEVVDETMHRGRVEAEVERSAAGRCRYAAKRARQTVSREDVIDFL